MNYRHAYHAGNFADVVKHILLTRILSHFLQKDAPFRVVDTHAGTGRYDLAGEEASRGREWQGGIGRLAEAFPPDIENLLAPYRRAVGETRARHGEASYPGSPAIIREMIRPRDRAILVEKHPVDAALLSRRYNGVGNMKVIEADGWATLPGLIPPRERRGLVLIDPPFEEPGELDRAASRLRAALLRWPTGTVAFWYPIKRGRSADDLAAALATGCSRPMLRLELLVDDSRRAASADTGGLTGSGLIVANPPWTLADQARSLLPALAGRLARSGAGSVLCVELPGAPGPDP